MTKFTRRKFIESSIITSSAVLAGSCLSKNILSKNLLIICVDDLNAWVNTLSPTQKIYTPWIDKLAERGTTFEYAYCAAPYCNSSRMAVFTACFPSTTGIFKDEPYWGQPQRKQTFIERLKRQNGYYTISAGKVFHGRYDYPNATREQLQDAIWIRQENRNWLWNEIKEMTNEPLAEPFPQIGIKQDVEGRAWSAQLDWGELSNEQEKRHPDVLTANAFVDFLKKPTQQPFLAIAGFYKPHLPWYAPNRWIDEYPLEEIQVPLQPNDLSYIPEIAERWVKEMPADDATLKAKGLKQKAVQAYKASISFADEQIGRVLQALWESEAADDTIVALWSDNGFHLGEKLHWRKFTLWEEATRVPLIISDPGNRKFATRVSTPVSLIDLFPTLLDLLGLPPRPDIDGHSLKPLMLGHTSKAVTPALTQWGEGNASIRIGHWRYTRYKTGEEELYDHLYDPLEHNNLAITPEASNMLNSLRKTFEKAQENHSRSYLNEK